MGKNIFICFFLNYLINNRSSMRFIQLQVFVADELMTNFWKVPCIPHSGFNRGWWIWREYCKNGNFHRLLSLQTLNLAVKLNLGKSIFWQSNFHLEFLRSFPRSRLSRRHLTCLDSPTFPYSYKERNLQPK